MFRAIFSVVGLCMLSFLGIWQQYSLMNLAIRLWWIIAFAWIVGGIFDLCFFAFYKEAVKQVERNGA